MAEAEVVAEAVDEVQGLVDWNECEADVDEDGGVEVDDDAGPGGSLPDSWWEWLEGAWPEGAWPAATCA